MVIFRVSTLSGFLALFITFVTAGHWNRHHQVAHRARGDVDLHRRQYFANSKFTYYAVGLGACGVTNVASDYIVAQSEIDFGSGYPGPNCFKPITIQYTTNTGEARTIGATIMDRCVACPQGGLDFSKGLFSFFDDPSKGVIYGNWWYTDSGGNDGQTTSSWTPLPSTTSTPDYTPPSTSSTSIYTPPSTTSPPTTSPPTTSPPMSSPPMSSTTLTSPNSSRSSSLSGLAVPTGTVSSPGTNNPQNILVINDILVEIGIALFAAEEDE